MGLMGPECETFVTFEICPMGLKSLQNCTSIAHKCSNFPGPGAQCVGDVCRPMSVVSRLRLVSVVCRLSSVISHLFSRLSSAVCRSLSSVVICLSFLVCRPLSVVYRLLSVVCRLLSVVGRVSFVVSRLLSAVVVVSRLLCVVSCLWSSSGAPALRAFRAVTWLTIYRPS